MRIIQITDLHIGLDGEDTYGIDVRGNFLKAKKAIQELSPDHIVLSGDLCYRDGNQEIYTWIRSHLEELDLSYDLISGNHDDPVLLAKVFQRERLLKGEELYFSRQLGEHLFLFLDTTPGTMSEAQYKWLEEQFDQWNKELIIFMHHPPIKAGVPYMDSKHSFREKEKIQEIFFKSEHPITVFTGHYHVEKTIRKKNVLVHITPSCFFQIDQHSPTFKVDHKRIAIREITLNNGTLMNTVRYL